MSLREFRDIQHAWGRTWLSPAEQVRIEEFRNMKRRQRWLTGRWLVKKLLSNSFSRQIDWCDMHIESHDGKGRSIAPRFFFQGKLQPHQFSITHSSRKVQVVIAAERGVQIGTDLTELTQLPGQFAKLWLGHKERLWCQASNNQYAMSVAWTFKEAIYKAMGRGVPFYPRHWDSIGILMQYGQILPLCHRLKQGLLFKCIGSHLAIEAQRIGRTFSVTSVFRDDR